MDLTESVQDKRLVATDAANNRHHKNECFISTLVRLKESSLEAVESSKSLSIFKKYMHTSRKVQEEFERILFEVAQSDESELILLCGSVGDGKSHLLSYYNENYPEIMESFTIHNDSTASFYLDKPAIKSLIEVLENFSDDKLNLTKQKLILAINLGTLNNFIEGDTDNKFKSLKKFVLEKKLLEDCSIEADHFKYEHFQYVNFADYHMYYIQDGVAKSDYIEELLNKLTSDNVNNIFFQKYSQLCSTCDTSHICPIKANFEMLKHMPIANEIIKLIIEAIIKSKLIVSTRALYNFFYEILVDRRFINTGSAEPKKDIAKLNELFYCEALLINNIFSQAESSELLNAICRIDPLNVRNEKLDDFVVDYNNKVDVLDIYNQQLPEMSVYLKKIEKINFEDFNRNELKKVLLKFFIRGYYLSGKKELFEITDKTYLKFVENLYYWNCGEKGKLKELYGTVKEGAFRWNGEADDNGMVVFIGEPQTRYVISQTVDVKPSLINLKKKDSNRLYQFSNTIFLRFEDNKSSKCFEVEVDYTLYELLSKILKGYRPNMKDKNLNIKFNNFVSQLGFAGSKDEVVIIKEKNAISNKVYKLEYSNDFGYTFEVV